ncbi:MAG: DsbA family protein [Parvibaculum sp.]|nr:DsbA family protein [Parvibaculum sp.]
MNRFHRLPAFPRFPALAASLIFFGSLAFMPAQAADSPRFEGKDKAAVEKIVHDYILENPEVLIEAMHALDKKQQAADLAATQAVIERNHKAIYNNPDDFVAGNPKGDVTIVEFFDYQCGYCKRSFEPLMEFVKGDGNVRLVLKEFPILGPVSLEASKAAIAAKKQGLYFEMHKALFSHKGQIDSQAILEIAETIGLDIKKLKTDMADPAIADAVSRQYNLAETLKIDGTPAFIAGGEVYPGVADHDRLEAMVKVARGS